MLSDDDLGWLAGLSDAEACFSARVHSSSSRAGSLVLQYEVGLVREDVMREVRRLIQTLVGELPELYRDPPKKNRRAFYRCRVVRKEQVETIVRALVPALNGKRLEARIEVDILSRVSGRSKYRATKLDADLCALSRGLKRGVADAATEAERLLDENAWPRFSPGAAWLAGMFDGDGSVLMITTQRDGHTYYQPSVNISSSDLVALNATKALVEKMGYGTTTVSSQKAKGIARSGHGFNVVAADIEHFLSALRPHLRVKGAEVDALLNVYEGKWSREEAYLVLRALKRADEPNELLRSVTAGDLLPAYQGPAREYRRATYEEMRKRGLWSSEEARSHLGGVGYVAWTKVTDGLAPNDTIGNKKYYAPGSLREHVNARLNTIVRADARERVRRAMDTWQLDSSSSLR